MKRIFNNMIIIMVILLIVLISNPLKNIDLSRFEKVSMKGIKEIIEITWENKNFDSYVLYDNWFGNSKYSLNQIDNAGLDASLYLRISHWMQMIDGFIKYPILGLGVSISGSAADGNYVRILCESGILGLIAWSFLLYNIYKTFDKKILFHRMIRYSFASVVIGAVLIDIFEASKVMMMFWFLLGLVYAYEDINRNKEE